MKFVYQIFFLEYKIKSLKLYFKNIGLYGFLQPPLWCR